MSSLHKVRTVELSHDGQLRALSYCRGLQTSRTVSSGRAIWKACYAEGRAVEDAREAQGSRDAARKPGERPSAACAAQPGAERAAQAPGSWVAVRGGPSLRRLLNTGRKGRLKERRHQNAAANRQKGGGGTQSCKRSVLNPNLLRHNDTAFHNARGPRPHARPLCVPAAPGAASRCGITKLRGLRAVTSGASQIFMRLSCQTQK